MVAAETASEVEASMKAQKVDRTTRALTELLATLDLHAVLAQNWIRIVSCATENYYLNNVF